MKNEFRNRIKGYIAAAFGLVAGLAWNEAIRSSIEYIFPLDKNSIWAKFIYAILLTIVLVIVTIYINRILSDDEKE
ncbi:MAG: hypothetical protein COU40_01520 [Candidatus Moranbacteria bacterium CG10_big_fil_rev_8_21_14_0_10_35_21]|nr:MAG: hypothetical protein COU40_01520 [Candidatus Moranbacteria bacterium CG10_big_fil_rev_8_21_14_0_10_35_21]PJA88474.1 MAG: hypothetical protein CO139_02950 [Candidatus Moranbacteria bacterium CG_4_9_14_3_um_filter_36_9]